MNDAQAGCSYLTFEAIGKPQSVGGAWRLQRSFAVMRNEAASSADLGGSSNYSSENLEG